MVQVTHLIRCYVKPAVNLEIHVYIVFVCLFVCCCFLCRYRNFRTFASPRPVQFSCLTLDPSGEVVCAGSHDTFELYVWSMQTGRLLEVGGIHQSHDGHVTIT